MTYYSTKAYKEKYYVLFDDVDGNQWKISIQAPNFSGTAQELTGGAEPVTWEGEGDESQEEVVLGSTGKISLVCLDGQQSLFTVGNVLPEVINDRRVQVLRYMANNWFPYWQGFIKPETFSQDWDAAPYEIELPIVSAVAATEYFIMPLPSESAFSSPFFEISNIAMLLRAIIVSIGCDFRRITTNKCELLDMTGSTIQIPIPGVEGQTYAEHWTQGTVSSLWFYNLEGGVMQPKTFKDVLETICYPYGKIHEYGTDIAFLMRTKDDIANDAKMYYMLVWEDYDAGTLNTAVRFGDDYDIRQVALSNIKTASTDNTSSMLPAPRSVNFTNDINNKKEIFELTDKLIKPTLPLSGTISGKTIEYIDLDGNTRYLYMIGTNYVDLTSWCKNWQAANTTFCRVIEVEGESNDDVNYNLTIPLGFCFNVNSLDHSGKSAAAQFTLCNGILSRIQRNVVKMTLKPYFLGQKEPIDGYVAVGVAPQYIAKIACIIYDETKGLYLNYNESATPQWFWSSSPPAAPGIGINNFVFENDECVLLFNEERTTGDNSPHDISITFSAISAIANSDLNPGQHTSDLNWGLLYMGFKLEYVKSKVFFEDVLIGEFAKNVLNNGYDNDFGGDGADLTINFETMACNVRTIDGSMAMPANSFCNAKTFIDTENREKIEINAAQFERYYADTYFDFVTSYAVVTDGSKVFIPVAVGMNPRMNTLKLTLVSTNVTS